MWRFWVKVFMRVCWFEYISGIKNPFLRCTLESRNTSSVSICSSVNLILSFNTLAFMYSVNRTRSFSFTFSSMSHVSFRYRFQSPGIKETPLLCHWVYEHRSKYVRYACWCWTPIVAPLIWVKCLFKILHYLRSWLFLMPLKCILLELPKIPCSGQFQEPS